MNNKTIITFGALAMSAASAGLIRSAWERKSFVLKTYEVHDHKVTAPYRMAFLSDLHGAVYGHDNDILIRCILDARPDVVLIGGDMCVTKPEKPMDFSAIDKILEGLKGHVPVYYAEGNHEQRMRLYHEAYPGWWQEFKTLIKKHDIPYLADRSVSLREDICLSGLKIDSSYYTKLSMKRMSPAYVSRHLREYENESGDRFRILLAHAPQYMQSYWRAGADLVLSGHFHGGVMVLPCLGPVVSPQFTIFPKYARGLYHAPWGDGCGIVSAGLGTHSVNIRIFNRPELVVVDLLPENS